MTKLHFDYCMEIKYTVPVSICHFTIKCIPKENARQAVSNVQIQLFPDLKYSRGTDSFENKYIYGRADSEHDIFQFRITGDVEIKQILYEEKAREETLGMYRNPYNLNQPGDCLKKYFDKIKPDDSLSDYEKCIHIMRRLHEDYSYQQHVTGINTTAEEAWATRGGVCQDYAHIMIALVQMAKIPCRYVTGMVTGEGASHAWVEVLWKNKWIGMDPTNNVLVADSHIKIGHGRDASDCMINRGVMRGGGNQTQKISVSVERE